MNERQKRLAGSLKKSIPSYINSIRKKKWTVNQAVRAFKQALDELDSEEDRLDLLNEFNRFLKISQAAPDMEDLDDDDDELLGGEEPTVNIDGPASVRANQSIILTAQTINLEEGEREPYQWQVQGKINGVICNIDNQHDDGSKLIIRASKACDNGTLYISAIGIETQASAAITISVIGSKEPFLDKKNIGKPDRGQEKTEESELKDKKQERTSWLRNLLKKEGREKIWDNIKKRFSKEALAALWKALLPYLPWIIAGILVLVLGIAVFAGLAKKASSGEAGSTVHTQVDLASDADLVEKVILSTGDQEAKTTLINKTFPEMRKNLLLLKDSANSETQAKIDSTCAKIDQYISDNNPDLGQEIVKSTREIMAAIGRQAPIISAKTRAPLEKITDYNFYLHYGTPLRKEMPTKDKQGHGTYMYYGEGKGDAVDLYSTSGSQVYPVFSGKIVDLSDDGTGHKKVVIQSGDYKALYANIETAAGLSQNQEVDISKPIGKIVDITGEAQLHLEMAYKNKPIVTTELDRTDYKDSNKPWGEYLWGHDKQILNLK